MNCDTKKMNRRGSLGISFLTVLLFCLPFFKMEYATDTYTIITVGMRSFGDSMFQNGRLVTAAAFYLFDALTLDIVWFYYTSLLLAVFFASAAVFQMHSLLSKRLPFRIAFPLAFLTVLNPLSIEYFLFIEKGYFMLALFMSVLALKFFVDFLEGRRIRLILACLCVTVSAFTYQTLPAAFAVLAVLFSVLYADQIKEQIKSVAVAAAVYGFGTFLNFLFIKLVGGSRRAGEGIYFSNLQKGIFFAGNILTPLLYLAVFVLLFFACGVYARRKGAAFFSKRSGSLFWKGVLTATAAICVTFFPFLFVDPAEVWFPCRILYPLGTLLGILPLLFLCEEKRATTSDPLTAEQKNCRPTRTVSLVCCVFLIFDFIFFQSIMISRLRNNALDEALCQKIESYIEAYERETGHEVVSVSIYHDAKITKHNPGVLFLGDSNVRAFSKDWSDVDHMSVLLNRSFTKMACDGAVYTTHFEGKDWSAFHEDQLVFVEDTLHLCVY